jgi:hypothetical protein
MDAVYRRPPPVSRLERLLARLLLRKSYPGPADPRVDLVHAEDAHFTQA